MSFSFRNRQPAQPQPITVPSDATTQAPKPPTTAAIIDQPQAFCIVDSLDLSLQFIRLE